MKKKIQILFLVFLVLGCSRGEFAGGSSSSQNAFLAPSEASISYKMEDGSEDYEREERSVIDSAQIERTQKLIRRAVIFVQVSDLEEAEKPVKEAINKYRAYFSNTEIRESVRSYTIRVPEIFFVPLLEELRNIGRIVSQSESAEDVTMRYYDLEGRLKTKRELRSTFQEYLKTARTIEEIMTVERHLAELQNEIDRMGTEFRSLANLIDYATITFELRLPSSSANSFRPDLSERIVTLFRSFGDFASLLLLIILGIIIYGIPSLCLFMLLYLLLFGKIGLVKKVWRIAGGNIKKEK